MALFQQRAIHFPLFVEHFPMYINFVFRIILSILMLESVPGLLLLTPLPYLVHRCLFGACLEKKFRTIILTLQLKDTRITLHIHGVRKTSCIHSMPVNGCKCKRKPNRPSKNDISSRGVQMEPVTHARFDLK